MSAYVIVDTKIKNAEEYEKYKALARPIVEQYGGTYLARGGAMQVLDDELWSPTRLVLLQFPDTDAARDFFDSDEYAPVKAIRHEHADSTSVIFEAE